MSDLVTLAPFFFVMLATVSTYLAFAAEKPDTPKFIASAVCSGLMAIVLSILMASNHVIRVLG